VKFKFVLLEAWLKVACILEIVVRVDYGETSA